MSTRTSTTVNAEGQYDGSGGTYSLPNAAYTLVPLSNTYASSVGNLNNGSPLISTINCVQAGGGTAYAEAIDAAYAELQKDGRPKTQKVIVFLSDGAANDAPISLPATSPYRTNPCGQGVTSAGIAKAAKVLVYSIAYTANGDNCYAAVGANVGGKIVTTYDGTLESPAIAAQPGPPEHRQHRQRHLLLRPPQSHVADRHLPANRGRHHRRHRTHRPIVSTP